MQQEPSGYNTCHITAVSLVRFQSGTYAIGDSSLSVPVSVSLPNTIYKSLFKKLV